MRDAAGGKYSASSALSRDRSAGAGAGAGCGQRALAGHGEAVQEAAPGVAPIRPGLCATELCSWAGWVAQPREAATCGRRAEVAAAAAPGSCSRHVSSTGAFFQPGSRQ